MTSRSAWVPLGRMLSPFEAGVSVNGNGVSASGDQVGVLKVSCVRDGRFFPAENKVVVPQDRERVAVSPKRGDILITRANTPALIGACGVVDQDRPTLFLSDKLWRTRARDPAVDDERFIVGILCSDAFRRAIKVRATGTSAGMKNISQASFLAIRVPRPPLDTQRAWGAALDLFASCATQATDLLHTKRRLKRALLQQLSCGRPTERLGQMLAPIETGVSVNGAPRPAASDEVGVLKVSCVREGRFVPHENKAVVGLEVRRVACSPKRGDILISRANTPDLIGACGLVEDDYPHLFLPDKIWRTRAADPNRDDARWIVGVLCSPGFRTAIKGRATGTSAGMKNIPQDSFLSIRVPRPDHREQVRGARILAALDHEIALLDRQLTAYRQLERGLMQKLLTGEVALPEAGARDLTPASRRGR